MDREEFEEAIRQSGGVLPAEDELGRVLEKLAVLEQAGIYNRLLQQLATANDRSNFLALLLEVTFAYQFERAGVRLAYEIKQAREMRGSVDFRHTFEENHLDFELRLVQQESATTEQIKQQLEEGPFFSVVMNATEEMQTVVRAQNIILSKTQDRKTGDPVKFTAPQANVTNIVVVDTHDLFLGAIDVNDCMLITYGDPEVEVDYRRGAFGLFQDYREEYAASIRSHHERFAHVRTHIHGIMFLFRTPGSGIFNYELRQFTIWNRNLMNSDRGAVAITEIQRAIPFNGK